MKRRVIPIVKLPEVRYMDKTTKVDIKLNG